MKIVLFLSAGLTLAASGLIDTMMDRALTVARRNDACFALRGQSSPEVIGAMRRALNDAKLRACAGENLRQARAIGPLREALRDEDAEVRAIALRELGAFEDPALLDTLARMARDPQLLVASNAIQALESYPFEQARPSLEQLAASGSLVGEMALDDLAQNRDPQAAPIARRLLAGSDIGGMLAGMRILARLGDESDLAALRKIAEKDTEQMSSKGRGFGLMPSISLSRAALTAIAQIQLRASVTPKQ